MSHGGKAGSTTRREFLTRAAATALTAAAGGFRPAAASAAARRGGTMVVTGHQEISSLSPDDAGPTVIWSAVTQIHNALLELDENFSFVPTLAQSYTAAPDGMSYTFKLLKGVRFHDGTEFTADDVKYTYEWYMNPANHAINANNFEGVDAVQAPDKYTIRVKMKRPNAAFLAKGASTFIVPAAYHGKVGEKHYKTAPIGTGAFRLKEWIPAGHTTVAAFDQHFRGRPNLDFFRVDIVPEPSVRAIGLQTGASDSAVWPLLTEDNLRFAKDAHFTTFVTITTGVNHFPINNKLPMFADKRVRQAMMYAINRQQLIDDVFKGTAVIATSHLSPAFKTYYEPNVVKYPYDVAKAKGLLDEAGWKPGPDGIRQKGGQRLSFTCTTITGDQARRPEAEIAQQHLKAAGIEMKLAEAPVATITDKMHKGEMDASLFNWTYGGSLGDPDPSVTLRTNGGNNWSHYSNPKVDSLIDAGLAEPDPKKRRPIYSEIQKIVAEDAPFIYAMYWNWYTIFAPRVKGLPKTAFNGPQLYRKAYQWSLG
ncbi:MAG TPA: ABC transporter substrate-binding protein [bacterium]|nr:ABC transporter substrate-binding protein [bacterium]